MQSSNFKIVLFIATLSDKVSIPFPQSVLLKKTEYLNFKWDLPSGNVRGTDEVFKEAILRIGKETIGVPIEFHSIIGVFPELPGLICLALPKEPVRESDDLKYFDLSDFPWGEVIPQQKQFINSYACQQMQLLAGLKR